VSHWEKPGCSCSGGQCSKRHLTTRLHIAESYDVISYRLFFCCLLCYALKVLLQCWRLDYFLMTFCARGLLFLPMFTRLQQDMLRHYWKSIKSLSTYKNVNHFSDNLKAFLFFVVVGCFFCCCFLFVRWHNGKDHAAIVVVLVNQFKLSPLSLFYRSAYLKKFERLPTFFCRS